MNLTSRGEALADFLAKVRGDWDRPGIVAALVKARLRDDKPDLWQVSIASIRVAGDPTVKTPAVIAMDGQHWRPWDDQDPMWPKPTPQAASVKGLRCPHCGQWAPEGEEQHRQHCGPRASQEAAAAAKATAVAEIARQAHTANEHATQPEED